MFFKKILTHQALVVCLGISLLVQPAARGGTASQYDIFGGSDLSFLFIAGILGLGSSPDNWVKQDLIQSPNALTPVIVPDCQSEASLSGALELRMPENSSISSVGQAIQVMSVEAASNSESSQLIAGELPEAALVHKGNGSNLILTDHDSPLCQQQAIPELFKVRRLDLTASQPFRQHSEVTAMVCRHQPYRPLLFIDIDEKGYVVFVVVELVNGQLPRVRVIKTQMVAMEVGVHQFLKQVAQYSNIVIVPVGQMLVLYFNDSKLMSMRLMDFPLQASDQGDTEYNHLATYIPGSILCIGNGGIFSGEFAGVQCPLRRNKAGKKGSGHDGDDEDEDKEKSSKRSRYNPLPEHSGPNVPNNYEPPDDEEPIYFGPPLPPDMMQTEARPMEVEPKKKPDARKLTLKEWQERQKSQKSQQPDHPDVDVLDHLREIRRQVEAKALAEAALTHLTRDALDSDRDLREFIELQRHFKFINAMLSAHSDEECQQLIRDEIKAMRESKGYTRDIAPFWWWTVSIFEQTHLAHHAAQFMQEILKIMRGDSDLAHALIWHMVHNGDVDNALKQIGQWESRNQFSRWVISDMLKMTQAVNARKIQGSPFSDFEPLSQLIRQKNEVDRRERDRRRSSEWRKRHDRRNECSKHDYLQQFDLQYQQVTRKLDRFGMPTDSLLEQGLKPKKKKGKHKKKSEPARSEATAVVSQPSGKGQKPRLEHKEFTDKQAFDQAVKKAQEEGVTFVSLVPAIDAALSPRKLSKKELKKAGKKQTAEQFQKQQVLDEFQRLGSLLGFLRPAFENLQAALDQLSPEQKLTQWENPAYQVLHTQCIDLMHRAQVFLEDNPESDVVKIRHVIDARGMEAFYRSVAQIREFLLLYYAQNADSISYKVLDGAMQQFFPQALKSSRVDSKLVKNFVGVTCLYCLALSHVGNLDKIYRHKISDPEERQQAVRKEANRIINQYYSLVAGMVTRAQFERLKLKEQSTEEEDRACHEFIEHFFDALLAGLSEHNFYKAIKNCAQFYCAVGDNSVQQVESQCRRVIASVCLKDLVPAMRGIKELAILAEQAREQGDQSHICLSESSHPAPRKLLFQETMRSCIELFIASYRALSDQDDLALHRMKLRGMEQTAESMIIWWNSVYPPEHTPEMAEARKILKKVAQDARQGREDFERRQNNQLKAVEKMAQALRVEEAVQLERTSRRAEKLKKLMAKEASKKLPAKKDTEDASQHPPSPAVAGAATQYEIHKAQLSKACTVLQQGNQFYAKELFEGVLDAENVDKEHRIWALYGTANCHMGIVSQLLQKQCEEAQNYLEEYAKSVSQHQLPPGSEGRKFHEKLTVFRDSLKALYLNTITAKKYFNELIELILEDGSQWSEDSDLIEAIADGMSECHSIVTPLADFCPKISDLYRDRGLLIREHMDADGRRPGASKTDTRSVVEDVTRLSGMLTRALEDIGETLSRKSAHLTRFDDQDFPDLSGDSSLEK